MQNVVVVEDEDWAIAMIMIVRVIRKEAPDTDTDAHVQ
jgi:hypothetical protein